MNERIKRSVLVAANLTGSLFFIASSSSTAYTASALGVLCMILAAASFPFKLNAFRILYCTSSIMLAIAFLTYAIMSYQLSLLIPAGQLYTSLFAGIAGGIVFILLSIAACSTG